MFAPVRFLYSFRPHAPLGLLAADAVAATMFVATPFLVPAVSDRLDVSLGVAGLISTAQVGGLTVTVFLLGRLARTSPSMLVAAATLLFVANGASALAGGVISLLLLRVVAGVGAGFSPGWPGARRWHIRGVWGMWRPPDLWPPWSCRHLWVG